MIHQEGQDGTVSLLPMENAAELGIRNEPLPNTSLNYTQGTHNQTMSNV